VTASRAERAPTIQIGQHRVAAGESRRFDLPAALLPTHTQLNLPVSVMNGLRPGPVVWTSAAVHGDELNGVEVIHRALERIRKPLERGAVIAVPIVNVFGFIGQSRYLPDRRDLNRSFPGSKSGSLAARIANLFMTEIVERCTHGIDLHTAAQDRTNLPQVRGDMTHPETRRIAEAFDAPAMVHSSTRDGSLRAAAMRKGIPTLVFEGGEALRFNERAIEAGVRGVLGVLGELGLTKTVRKRKGSMLIEKSTWIRARRGGLFRPRVSNGDFVEEGQTLGTVGDALGADPVRVRAPFAGLVIGRTNNPVVHGGDGLLHLGRVDGDPTGRSRRA